jgi:hypothetical protein
MYLDAAATTGMRHPTCGLAVVANATGLRAKLDATH